MAFGHITELISAAHALCIFQDPREDFGPHTGDVPTLPTQLAQAIEEKYWLAKYVWEEDDFFDGLLNDSGIPMDMLQKCQEIRRCERVFRRLLTCPLRFPESQERERVHKRTHGDTT